MQNKIPIINDSFDVAIFMQILKKSFWIIPLFFILSIIGAFLYLRYTLPVYTASSVIQINESNRTTQILKIEDVYSDDDISKIVELLRSKEFLKRALGKLNLQVSYYIEGTFIATELYNKNPFTVEWKAESKDIFDRPFYIEFFNDKKAELVTYNGDKDIRVPIEVDQWLNVTGGKVRFSINDYKTILDQKNNYKGNRFYFVIHNPQHLVDLYTSKIDINLLNRYAKTIEITFSGYNAEKAADIVNAIASDYLVYDVEIKKESADNILAFIEDRLKVVYHNLNETEKELHKFKKDNKINSKSFNDTGSPFPIFMTKMNELEDELMKIEFELTALERVNNQISEEDNLNIYELIAMLSGTKSETIVVSVLNNLQELINKREQLLNDITPDNLKIKILNKQIENQKQLLKDFISSTVTRLKNRQNDYKEKIAEYEKKTFSDLSYNELEYSRLERLYSINEGFYHQLIEKKAEYLISQAGYVSQNTILEKAEIPVSPVSPIKKKIYPLFVLLGMFISMAFIVIRYLMYDEVPNVQIIKNYTDAPILGTIPTYRKKVPVSQLLVDKKLNSLFSESFRTIRSNLQFISHGAETKIITISSTVSGEGKTFVALNLGGILAISGKKVIILDLDLRRPRIHIGFNKDNSKGISTILIGKDNLNDCIEKSELDNLDYITTGPIPPNPAELAGSRQMDNLISELEEIYDVIIIDTPPVGIVTDALVNLQRANYPIYVMKANVSKRHYIENINMLIRDKNMDNLSIILNGVNIHSNRYGSYGYNYGYGYYSDDDDDDISIGKRLTNKLFKLKK